MKKFWLIASGLGGVAALVLALLGDFDKMFVVAALGAMAWFLHYRAQIRERLALSEQQTTGNEEAEPDEEE